MQFLVWCKLGEKTAKETWILEMFQRFAFKFLFKVVRSFPVHDQTIFVIVFSISFLGQLNNVQG